MCVPNQAGVDLIIPVRIKKPKEKIVCSKDQAKRAKAAVYPDADKTLMTKFTPKVQHDPIAMKKIFEAYKFSVKEILSIDQEYQFTGICIQSKNKEHSGQDEDLGVDSVYAGVHKVGAGIPCLSIKHVLRSSSSDIQHMRYQGKPYRHGVIVRGLDNNEEVVGDVRRKVNSGFASDVYSAEFVSKAKEILETKANGYSYIEEMDSTVLSAGHTSNDAHVSEEFIRRYEH
jgi:hypothetical protein